MDTMDTNTNQSPFPMKETIKSTVTVVGGGSSAHVLIPFLFKCGHRVNLMTRRPEQWKRQVSVELRTMDDKTIDTIQGSLNKISSVPAEVIPEADVIILCMPVHQYPHALHRIAPYINISKHEVFVGTVYGQAGFNWMCHEVERKLQLKNITCFAVGLIPWICRTIEYGSKGVNYGCKKRNIVAVSPANRFEKLNDLVLNDMCYSIHGTGKFLQACSFLSLTLSVDNQIIHPSRCYGLWMRYGGKWATEKDIPYFYKDYDALSADILRQLDADYTRIRDAVRKHFPHQPFNYMLDYLTLERFTHESQNDDIQKSFQESKQLGLIKTPCVQLETGEYGIDIQSRFFTDDIPFGLLIAKWVAEQLHVDTPMIDEIITWAQTLRGWEFLNEDGTIKIQNAVKGNFVSGIPPAYGITSVDSILE
uniref:Opine dehydrogenase domain-containing protein n=1 Tax=Amphora coffeiformis TaxID=265554 RepID=A0A7S3L101_9STRA|mmetsp:Transcript_6198/g.12130  ORF Transcript_6198/g.12130 Transcript_6198/m.12130 type:complete len:420 (+) Transcript_6198:141-1400(+)